MLNATPWVESVSGTGNTFSEAMNLRELSDFRLVFLRPTSRFLNSLLFFGCQVASYVL